MYWSNVFIFSFVCKLEAIEGSPPEQFLIKETLDGRIISSLLF